jgi:hypothetical protein
MKKVITFVVAVAVGALGVAARLVPLLERNSRIFRRLVLVSFPVAVAIAVLAWGA